jgi:hypothetical protein
VILTVTSASRAGGREGLNLHVLSTSIKTGASVIIVFLLTLEATLLQSIESVFLS